MADIEIMTPREKQMEQRNAAIIAEFKALNPEVMTKGYKPYRTLCVLAKKHNMTPAGVRYILAKKGVITTLSELSEKAE